MTASLYNGLALLCRLGGGVCDEASLVFLEILTEDSIKGAVLDPKDGLVEFEKTGEYHIEGVLVDQMKGGDLGERLVFQSLLTVQPLITCRPWLGLRLANRFEEIELFEHSKKLGAPLCSELKDIAVKVRNAPEWVSYRHLLRVWLECISKLNPDYTATEPDKQDCFQQFLTLEKDFARLVWTGKDFSQEVKQLFDDCRYNDWLKVMKNFPTNDPPGTPYYTCEGAL